MADASAASLTWGPEEPALGWIVRPRVTPPLSAFFRLSFTSVISSSRLTRSSSFTLHSSSTFFSRSDSDAWDRLPCGCRGRRKVQLPGSDDSIDIFRATTKRLINRLSPSSLLSPAAASTAVRRSLLSFFSWVRWFLMSFFLFISSSSLVCSLLASASTRFLPYLHCSESAGGKETAVKICCVVRI